MQLDFSRCRKVWIPTEERWNPPPPHVEVGVREIIAHPWFLLADDMGGMKSAQACIAAQFLHDADVIDRVIIVSPASVRSTVWFSEELGQLNEQAFDDKRLRVVDYHQRIRTWERGPKDAKQLRIICANYEYIRQPAHLKELLPYCGPKTMLILDESSAVRNWDSKQTDACMLLRWKQNHRGRPVLGVPRCGRILEMNGTPVAESPRDLFSQANLLHPDVLQCRYITHFEARYAIKVPVMGGNGPMMSPYLQRVRQPDGSIKKVAAPITQVAEWTNLPDLQARMAPYVLRREAKDFGVDFALPPVGLEVTLTPATWKHYKDMRDQMVIWLKSGVATSATAAVRSMRLSQITSGFVGGIEDANVGEADLSELDFDGVYGEPALAKVYEALASLPKIVEIGREKLDFALEWQTDLLRKHPDLKLLSWCRFVPELRRYLNEVKAFGHPVGAACGEKIFEGEHNQKSEREHALRLLHPKTAPAGPATVGATQGTGALGLNFTACRTVLDISYDFSSFKKKQGDARVNRTGQTGPVSFFYLIAVGPKGQKTIDHHIMLGRTGKMNLNDWTTAAWVRALTEE